MSTVVTLNFRMFICCGVGRTSTARVSTILTNSFSNSSVKEGCEHEDQSAMA